MAYVASEKLARQPKEEEEGRAFSWIGARAKVKQLMLVSM